MLTANKLSKAYGGRLALDGLDLEVPGGEIFCLLGPNGAGKTTTLNLFLGFTSPSSGAAYIASERVDLNPVAARRRIAYVPEDVRLYPQLSGCENLEYFTSLSRASVPDRPALEALLLRAGLPKTALHRPASGYSKGMRQKVALALSHAKNASALLLDEPTSGLDPSAGRELCAALRKEAERGAAVLMVTHDLGAVASVAHRVGIMRAGQLVHVAAGAELSEVQLVEMYRAYSESTREGALVHDEEALGAPALT